MAENNVTGEADKPRGISCPRCGCCDLRYSYHRVVFGKKRQVKFCRHCGKKVTVEVTERVLDSENRTNHGQTGDPLPDSELQDGEVSYD